MRLWPLTGQTRSMPGRCKRRIPISANMGKSNIPRKPSRLGGRIVFPLSHVTDWAGSRAVPRSFGVHASKYEHLHIYPIHPRAAAQFRAALYPSGAKDDPVDANLLLDLLVHHRGHLRRLSPDTEQTRLVQLLVETRRKLVNEKTRQGNLPTSRLKLYFPQILTWFDELDSALVGALLKRWPTLEALQKARPATLRSFFTQHNCRRAELIEQRLEQIRQAIPAIRDAAVIQSAVPW